MISWLVKDTFFTGIIGDPGGIPNEEFNALHTVRCDITFTIKVARAAVTENGGLFVFGSFNTFRVLTCSSGIINHANTH